MRALLSAGLGVALAIGLLPGSAHADSARPVSVTVPAGSMTPFTTVAGPAGMVLSGSTGPSPTRFGWPVSPPARVLTPFNPPAHRYGSGHRGVDLAATAGSAVRAAGPGTVVYAGQVAGRGVVSIQHADGLRTTYEPVVASVTAGQHVARGTVIGTLNPGHPSCAPADCLHFGARLPGRVYIDPMVLIGPWTVRLKPWGDA